MVNPDLLGGASIVENEGRTLYNSMALEFKRRSTTGLGFSGSYVFGHATQSRFLSLRVDSPMVRNDGAEGDVTHVFQFNAVYPLPFGQARSSGSAQADYETTTLITGTQARVVQIVSRIRW